MVSVAWRDPFTACVASGVPLSLKVIVPVGVPPKAPVTVAVKVVDWLKVVGFTELTSTVLVFALLTTCPVGGDVVTSKVMPSL